MQLMSASMPIAQRVYFLHQVSFPYASDGRVPASASMPSMLGVITSVDALAMADAMGIRHGSMPAAYNNHITPCASHDGALRTRRCLWGACAAEHKRMPLVRVKLTTISFHEMLLPS